MKVKDFIKLLRAVDQDREVILQSDPEGNSYAPFNGFWCGAYTEDGEAGMEKLTKADMKLGYTEEDLVAGKPALFLVPE